YGDRGYHLVGPAMKHGDVVTARHINPVRPGINGDPIAGQAYTRHGQSSEHLITCAVHNRQTRGAFPGAPVHEVHFTREREDSHTAGVTSHAQSSDQLMARGIQNVDAALPGYGYIEAIGRRIDEYSRRPVSKPYRIYETVIVLMNDRHAVAVRYVKVISF